MLSTIPGESSHGRTIRSSEYRRLTGILEELAEGHGSVTAIAGDPGTGKTRLLTALSDEAERKGLVVLRAGCGGTLTAGRPYQAFIEALGGWRGSRSMVLHPAAARLVQCLTEGSEAGAQDADWSKYGGGRCRFYAGMRRELAEALAEADRGVLLLLDDFHGADPGSVDLVETLLDWPVEEPLAVVVAHRPRQSPLRLHALLDRGSETGALRLVELGALSLPQSAALLDLPLRAPELRELHRRGDGIPLYLIALAAAETCQSEVPAWQRVSARLLAETEALADRDRDVLAAAAVLGDHFDTDAVAQAGRIPFGEACDSVASLVQHDLIRTSEEGSLVFRHPLLRQCLYEAMDACKRRGLHRRALNCLSRRGEPPLELVRHVEGASSEMEAGDAVILAAAAEEALHRDRLRDAGRWLAMAMRLSRQAGGGDVTARIRLPVARALAAEGRLASVREVRRETLLTLPADDHGERAAAVAWFATVETLLGNPAEARSLVHGETYRLRDHDAPTAARLGVQHGLARALRGLTPLPGELEAVLRDSAADPHARGGALALRGLTEALSDDRARAAATLSECARAVDASQDEGIGLGPERLGVLGWGEALIGRYSAAAGHLERAVAAARSTGEVHLLTILLTGLALVRCRLGGVASAHELAGEAQTVASATGAADHAGLARVMSATSGALLRIPDVGGITGDLDDLCGPEAWWRPLAALLLADAAMVKGDPGTAQDLVLAGGGGANLPTMIPGMTAHAYEVFAAVAVHGVDCGEEWAERAAAVSADLPAERAYVLMAAGHARADRSPEALRDYEAAFELFAEAGMVCEQMRALLAAAPHAARTGQGPRALRMLDNAERLGRRHGVVAMCEEARRCRRELAGDGPAVLSGGGTAALGELTQRERQIAQLAGEGLKTRDIAVQLHISPRTVGVHLTRIYAKLNVGSRAALARLMAQVA
ncbi:helix-turn-helix transcriptional regulator [Streptomyces sp. NBC_01198]|uniref:helix-turn-helix transcriptional regulator n=1 Tax=Streptomyces sp. NBC_01198 TaxID=2903769 RepID=UPI002E131DCF|nr:AAA family ATPase [Streptomyces sp. NBC_01198]